MANKRIVIEEREGKAVSIDAEGLCTQEVLGLLDFAALYTRTQQIDLWCKPAGRPKTVRKPKPKANEK